MAGFIKVKCGRCGHGWVEVDSDFTQMHCPVCENDSEDNMTWEGT